MSVKGNVDAFESSNPWLKDGFVGNYRTSLFANGNLSRKFFINGAAIVDSRVDDEYRTVDPSIFRLRMSMQSTEPLWDGWRFTGEGIYDPQRRWEYENLDLGLLTQPQEPARLELLARLESDKYGYIEGGSLHPGFNNSEFTLSRRSLFGIYGDLHNDKVGAEVVAGKLEGQSFREGANVGIRADGTSGPYDLANAPVTRGSEVVKIEARDRFDESTVISSETLTRDIDYSIDYMRGRIILNQPVASETVSSDPVYIVITYDFLQDENDELYGSRLKATPVDEIEAGVSYLYRNRDDGTVTTGEMEPEDLGSFDFNFNDDKYGSAYFEIAQSENYDEDENNQAIRAGWEGQFAERLSLKAGYQRIDDQFRSFTNTDLNPTKNQERLELEGEFDLTSRQTISAAFNKIDLLEPNGEYNYYSTSRDENRYLVGYDNRLLDNLGFRLKYERRDVESGISPVPVENSSRDRIIADIDGYQDDFPYLGRFGYGLHYELNKYEDDEANFGEGNFNTNLAALTLSSVPTEGTWVELRQKFRIEENRDTDRFDEREDATFLTVRVQPRKDLSVLTTIEYKRFTAPGETVQFWQNSPDEIDRTGTFAIEYLPFEKLKALGKFGRHETEQWYADSTIKDTDDFTLAQFTYFYNHHLSFNIETEYSREVRKAPITSRGKIWDLGVKANWNKDRFSQLTAGLIRRWQLYDYAPSAELEAESYILLFSGAASLGKGFFARGSVKTILLQETLDDEKTFLQLEIGYEGRPWYRISAGYERIESDTEEHSDQYYRGQGFFLRLTGLL